MPHEAHDGVNREVLPSPRADTMSGIPPPAEGLTPPPVTLTSFIGRDEEMAAVITLLRRADIRMLTLTGPGGSGKTRLALRVMETVRETTGAAWAWVSLAPVRDPDLVLPTIAQALNVPDAARQALLTRVERFLADQVAYLVLDNAEHLRDMVASIVADLVARCPGLTVLCTSRSRLGISAEQVFPLNSLKLSDARQLFAVRAGALVPAFVLTPESVPIIDEICSRLDRLPLAIELAAARLPAFPPPALLRQLDHRLPLLTDGPRDAPDRQRDMRATIAWSYDLIPENQRALLCRLGVFMGGFTLEAAKAVGGAGDDIVRVISALVDASLVKSLAGVESEPRFTMLETIREYALEQLIANGDETVARTIHATDFLALAEETEWCWFLPLPEGEIVLARLQVETDNLRAALRCSRFRRTSGRSCRWRGAWVRSG